MKQFTPDAGYYTISIEPSQGRRLLLSNNERAFIIAQLQDILSVRSLLEEPNSHLRLASHIDLLAFSLLPSSIHLVVFSISKKSSQVLAELLRNRLVAYRSEWHIVNPNRGHTPFITIKQLTGPFDALEATLRTHLRHLDWEFDRYSSIGFYLHDRRGDWMRIWRLTPLYENTPTTYYRLLRHAPELIRAQLPFITSSARHLAT